jgi:hypothetical protein
MKDTLMKHIATVALMLNLGVAGVYAQQSSVKMQFSGTSANSTINLLQPNTSNDEDNFAGDGTFGPFTYRAVRAISNAPTTSSTCLGANKIYFTETAGAAVFRFQDGSLLKVTLLQGGDCIDFAAPLAHCTLTFQITGGTGRFIGAFGTLTFTEAVAVVISDTLQNPVFFAATGEFTGTVWGISAGKVQDERQ